MNYCGNPISGFKPDFRFLETFETLETLESNKTSTSLESSTKYDPHTDISLTRILHKNESK
jgi:hypothetical protein